MAADMPEQVPVALRRERAKKLRELGTRLAREFVEGQIGREVSVLVEKDNKGYSENYIQVRIEGGKIAPNRIVRARLVKSVGDGSAIAEIS
jgi:threonylcarbamoyladenosine tRNA methylthiotransferase MtaB